MTSFDLTGKVAVVTGASRGLGQTFARALARAGADLAITSRTLDSLKTFQAEVEGMGRRAVPLELDVRDEGSIRRMVSDAAKAFGRIDILVNNAGCNVRKPAVDVTWDDWNLILDTNLRGAFFVAQSVAREMIPHGRGRIINIGSVTSVMGYAGLGPYGASRGGIRQLTMSLADDWGPHGITVNCLAPGWFKTEQNKVMYEDAEWVAYLVDRIPMRRPGQDERSRGSGRVSRIRRERIRHRADAAGGWRDFDRGDAGTAQKKIAGSGVARSSLQCPTQASSAKKSSAYVHRARGPDGKHAKPIIAASAIALMISKSPVILPASYRGTIVRSSSAMIPVIAASCPTQNKNDHFKNAELRVAASSLRYCPHRGHPHTYGGKFLCRVHADSRELLRHVETQCTDLLAQPAIESFRYHGPARPPSIVDLRRRPKPEGRLIASSPSSPRSTRATAAIEPASFLT